MFLRTLPLRLKLIAAVLIPLAVVAGFLGVQVAGGLEDRDSSQQQLDEVRRFEAVVAYATSIGAEAQTITESASTATSLQAARDAVDAAYAVLLSSEIDIDAVRLADLEAVQLDVLEIRPVIGTNPVQYRFDLTQPTAGSMTENPVSRLNGLRTQALNGFDFDRPLITDPAAAQFLSDVRLLERIETNLGVERSLLVNARIALRADLDSATLTALHDSISRTDESIQVFAELGSAQANLLFADVTSESDWLQLQRVRDSLRGSDVSDAVAITASVADVQGSFIAAESALTSLELAETAKLNVLANESLDDANSQLVRAGAIGGGLLLLVAIIVTMLYRAIRRPLRDLTLGARRVAEVGLPEVVRAARAGEDSAGEHIEMIESYTNDEIGELVEAFNEMHRTAVDLAAEQASSRRVVADMFVNLGRRNQKLLNRMLKGLTVLEREEQDPDKLEALYKVDHLATRMRRNAESLLILAGASQARSWNKAIPVYDVVQAALAEVENFERVDIEVTDEELVKGDYVADLAHILAELTENALAFSPPDTRVDILARQTRRGYVIVVSDAGIGMPQEQLEEANARILAAGSQEETPSEFLGHYVVGRLAARHGFTVDLLEGVAGTSVRVLLPHEVLEPVAEEDDDQPDDLASVVSLEANADSAPEPEPAAEMEPFEESFAEDAEDAESVEVAESADPSEEVDDAVVADAEPVVAEEVADEPKPAKSKKSKKSTGEDLVAGDPTQPLVPPVELPHRRPKQDDDTQTPAASEPEPVLVGGLGVRRRKPGANLPVTTITTKNVIETDLDNPDGVRSSLSGFQSGTSRADKENN